MVEKMKLPEMKKDAGMEELRLVLASRGWTHVIEPSMQNWLAGELDKLSSLSSKRPEGETDDYIRGRVSMVKQVLLAFKQQLATYDANRFAEAQSMVDDPPVGSPYAKTEDDPQ